MSLKTEPKLTKATQALVAQDDERMNSSSIR
jgi:hypothetical protein